MDKPINIVVIAPYQVYPAQMGGQKCIASFYESLAEKVPVTLISTSGNEEPGAGKVTLVKALGNSFLRYLNLFLFFKTHTIIRRGRFTHVVVEHPYLGWLGYLHKKMSGVLLVVHSHNIEAMRFKSTGRWWWKLLWYYERFVHRIADTNFFITDDDRKWAESNYGLNPVKCFTITYGTPASHPPTEAERKSANDYLRTNHRIAADESILLFNGTLDYKPNLDALMILLDVINPALQARPAFKYKLIICGKALPASLNNLASYINKDVIYAGFVKDINSYFLGSQLFLNPVIEGGGIKTKLVEALAYNLSCISTQSGAIGIPQQFTGEKLTVIPDGNWKSFEESIIITNVKSDIPGRYFEEYYWGNIADKAIGILNHQK